MAKFTRLTKEQLQELVGFPDVHKEAIESAIHQFVHPDEHMDVEWPDYFRAAEVNCQLECQISDDDQVDICEYETDCVWFAAGWKSCLCVIKEWASNQHEE